MPETKPCAVCGGESYRDQTVIWQGLREAWELSEAETALVDRQQGTTCTNCNSTLRSIALAEAICRAFSLPTPFKQGAARAPRNFRSLEVNPAGTLSKHLARLPKHNLMSWPRIDMTNMDIADATFDLVVHSDTLEHISTPVRALSECRRVLRAGGALCYTVPVLPGRLTRSRSGMAPSWHGMPGEEKDDYLVHTEYGADAWVQPMEAGFRSVDIVAFEWPAALALVCRA